MTHTVLKRIRGLYPGIFALIYMGICGYYKASPVSIKIGDIEINQFIIILLFGFVYNAFDCRNIIWNPLMEKVRGNIINRMIKIAKMKRPKTLTDQQQKSIFNLFYHYVDSDHTLTVKSRNVMFNGAFFSCAVDTIILSVVVIIVEVLSRVFSKTALTGGFWRVLIIIIAICAIACIFLFRRHLALSNDQLDYIKDYYSEDCSQHLEKFLKNEQ